MRKAYFSLLALERQGLDQVVGRAGAFLEVLVLGLRDPDQGIEVEHVRPDQEADGAFVGIDRRRWQGGLGLLQLGGVVERLVLALAGRKPQQADRPMARSVYDRSVLARLDGREHELGVDGLPGLGLGRRHGGFQHHPLAHVRQVGDRPSRRDGDGQLAAGAGEPEDDPSGDRGGVAVLPELTGHGLT